MTDVIPEELLDKANENGYAGAVPTAFDRFQPILGNSNSALFFFPEYTDHGPDHIRNVLATIVGELFRFILMPQCFAIFDFRLI